jgi:hypothetical protein
VFFGVVFLGNALFAKKHADVSRKICKIFPGGVEAVFGCGESPRTLTQFAAQSRKPRLVRS